MDDRLEIRAPDVLASPGSTDISSLPEQLRSESKYIDSPQNILMFMMTGVAKYRDYFCVLNIAINQSVKSDIGYISGFMCAVLVLLLIIVSL